MTGTLAGRTVLVLTDRPEDYAGLFARLSLAPLFASTVQQLLDLLLEHPTSGFVLEVGRVMRSKIAERDHLLQVAGAFPLLRVQRKPRGGALAFLDDLQDFQASVLCFTPRTTRSHARVPVRLNVLATGVADLGFEFAVRANMLDVSVGGGFVYTLTEFTPGDHVGLRIMELTDPAPIMAHVRWHRGWGLRHTLPGMGLLFTDIRPGQADEILTRYVAPAEQGE